VVWAIGLGVLPLVLLSLGRLTGNEQQKDVLGSLQTASVVVSLPILFIGVMMAASLTILLFRHNK
jgi:choline-glycine betaine transporter